MNCDRQPEVVHPVSPLHSFVQSMQRAGLGHCFQAGCNPTSFSYSSGGELEWCGQKRQPNCAQRNCGLMKETMVRAGYALPTDAMYWGMKAVCDVRGVAEILVDRFPEIIVDEAQDTTDIQFEILKGLWREGCNMVLVGDPDQSIFEFSGGRPDRFIAFEKECKKSFQLSKNFRSSQKICKATRIFSRALAGSVEACGPDRDFPAKPVVLKYDHKKPAGLVDNYLGILSDWAIGPDGAVVLCRTHKLLGLLSGRGT